MYVCVLVCPLCVQACVCVCPLCVRMRIAFCGVKLILFTHLCMCVSVVRANVRANARANARADANAYPYLCAKHP